MAETSDEILRRALGPGERLLWLGKPKTGFQLRPQDAFLIPFSVVWCGFALFWETTAYITTAFIPDSPSRFPFRLGGIPFICVGLYMLFGRFILDARLRGRTAYGVTPERVLIVTGLFSQRIKSLQLRTLSDVTLEQKADGSGTITFGPPQALGRSFGDSSPGTSRVMPPAFELIEDAKSTYDLICKAQREAHLLSLNERK
jgi:hypothetical protein